MSLHIDWLAEAESRRESLVAERRYLHQHPELAFSEQRTAARVAQQLRDLGLEVTTGVGQTGVVGVLEGAREGLTVLVRCDMDALPIQEANDAPYVSEVPGRMHACGHDGHTAIGLTVARMLAARRETMAGRVKFVFQPAEEIGQGAAAMIRDGVLDAPAPQVSLGLHLWNEMPVGTVSLTEGAMMASANRFLIRVRGQGGHGAMPQQTHDPLAAGAQIVTALNGIVGRNIGGLETAVLSVCRFQSGFTHNVIPAEAEIEGTFRTYHDDLTRLIENRIESIANGIATAMNCKAELVIENAVPPLRNDSATNARLRDVFAALNVPNLRLIDSERTMASEDMALFLARVPGTFFLVGSANAGRGLNYPHHHPRFDFDEAVLPLAAALLAGAVGSYVFENLSAR